MATRVIVGPAESVSGLPKYRLWQSARGRENLNTVAPLEACGISAAERRWVDPRDLLSVGH